MFAYILNDCLDIFWFFKPNQKRHPLVHNWPRYGFHVALCPLFYHMHCQWEIARRVTNGHSFRWKTKQLPTPSDRDNWRQFFFSNYVLSFGQTICACDLYVCATTLLCPVSASFPPSVQMKYADLYDSLGKTHRIMPGINSIRFAPRVDNQLRVRHASLVR